MMMCNVCLAKAQKIAQLAKFFEEKARETSLVDYVELMTKAALDLEVLSKRLATRCQCCDQHQKYSDNEPREEGQSFGERGGGRWPRYVDFGT